MLEGPSFTVAIKLLATLLVLGLITGATQAWQAGTWQQWSPAARAMVALHMLTMLAAYGGMLKSRTSIDGQRIRQTGLWSKQVELAQITQLKLIHVPGLSWLVAPRLMVRSGGLGMTTFHVADERVLAALRRLAYG